ncbi:MAG: N-formylglutamate amidohydrolase [Chloroflexi bacterium]|nr:N-formylglutamate amidohydrolase [Chloroflexota bacterium]MBU1747787.1 N-formylglutamate amidohydrolase [Chloroflexota bacterium]
MRRGSHSLQPEPLTQVYTVSSGDVLVPLLAHMPHSATHIPPDLRPAIFLGSAALERKLLALTDGTRTSCSPRQCARPAA